MSKVKVPYTEGEDEFLRRFFYVRRTNWLAVRLGRTQQSVRARSKRIGLSLDTQCSKKFTRTVFGKKEDQVILDMWPAYTCERIAARLNKTACDVQARIKVLEDDGEFFDVAGVSGEPRVITPKPGEVTARAGLSELQRLALGLPA